MSMATPKNTSTAHMALAATSFIGTLCLAYAATGGRLAALFPESYYLCVAQLRLNHHIYALGGIR